MITKEYLYFDYPLNDLRLNSYQPLNTILKLLQPFGLPEFCISKRKGVVMGLMVIGFEAM